MKRRSRRTRKRRLLRMWNHAEAMAAVCYIRSIVRAIREHFMEAHFQEQQLRRLTDSPGRPDRSALIARHELGRQLDRTRQALAEDVHELDTLGITSLDPARGLALIPFLHDDRLAWYIFDLYDPRPLRFWRYTDDPSDTRRPVGALHAT